jgi:hypothetical protein
MAYQSRSRRGGSRGGGGGRSRGSRGGRPSGAGGGRPRGGGGRRGPPPRGGGSNPTPMILAGVLLVAVIAVIVVVAGKDKPKKKPDYVSTELTADSKVDKAPAMAKKPERAPPPEISKEIIERAKELVTEMEDDRTQGEALYDEAMTAKQSGNRDKWKAKLNEAKSHYLNIKEKWNEEIIEEILGELPPDCEWDAEEVANYYLGKEGGKVSKALERLAYIKKQLGVR